MPLSGKIVVTGGRTFLGSHVVERLLKLDEKVVLLEPDGLEIPETTRTLDFSGVETVRCSADEDASEELVDRLTGISALIHLASLEIPVAAHTDPDPYVRKHFPLVSTLFYALRVHRDALRRVIVASSASVYGEGAYHCASCKARRFPFFRGFRELDAGNWMMDCNVCGRALVPVPASENKERRASDVVGITHRDIEDLAMTFGRHHHIPVTALRFFHLYGPGMNLDAECGEVIASTMTCARAGSPPTIFEDGEQSRDFLFVRDAVAAVTASMHARDISWRSINVGSGTQTTIRSLVESLCRLMGYKDKPLIPGTYRRWDVRHLFADISQAQRSIFWEPRVPLEEGLQELVDWDADQPECSSVCGAGSDLLEQDGLIRPAMPRKET
jgi:dTDP-L-rhamnose 4-epimerase